MTFRRMESRKDKEKGWMSSWLGILKEEARNGFHPHLPKYGFGAMWAPPKGAPASARLRYTAMRTHITRKTFLPAIVHAAERCEASL